MGMNYFKRIHEQAHDHGLDAVSGATCSNFGNLAKFLDDGSEKKAPPMVRPGEVGTASSCQIEADAETSASLRPDAESSASLRRDAETSASLRSEGSEATSSVPQKGD